VNDVSVIEVLETVGHRLIGHRHMLPSL